VKYINKKSPPVSYKKWRKKVRGTIDEDYRRLRNPLKSEVLLSLLKEQGYICAYTMKRIYAHNAHIEHIKPETLCRFEMIGSDLDYDNMVACFPEEGMPSAFRYGAQKKSDWWENSGQSFISPLKAVCELRFEYKTDGTVHARNNNPDAKKTINVLALGHDSLTEDRANAIKEFLWGDDGTKPLSVAEAKHAATIIHNKDGKGEHYEYCIAIRHALLEYLKIYFQQAKRRKFSRK
jgi:uncharacterized protein (TIGR02646 family)